MKDLMELNTALLGISRELAILSYASDDWKPDVLGEALWAVSDHLERVYNDLVKVEDAQCKQS